MNPMSPTVGVSAKPSKALHVGLWVVQTLLGATFVSMGLPGLTVLAALGCALLQVSAIVFHLSRGEGANTPFNFLLVALSLFVFWGRRTRAPIPPRH